MAGISGTTANGQTGILLDWLGWGFRPLEGGSGVRTIRPPIMRGVLPGIAVQGQGDAAVGVIPPGTLPPVIVQAVIETGLSRIITGHPIRIFNIPQVVNLTYPVSTYEGIIMNNYPVNRTDFRLVRGVNNAVLFFVRDIDRKPVSMQPSDRLVINIVDTNTDTLLMRRQLTTVDLAKGLYNFSTLPAEMDTWPTGPVRWSVTYTNELGTMMLWTDQNYSPYSALYVTEKPIPGPPSVITLAWSDFSLVDGLYYSEPLRAAASDGYANGMQTFVVSMTNFTGNVRIDGTLVAAPTNNDWFIATSSNYGVLTGQAVLNAQGNFVWTRIVVNAVGGTLDRILYKE